MLNGNTSCFHNFTEPNVCSAFQPYDSLAMSSQLEPDQLKSRFFKATVPDEILPEVVRNKGLWLSQ